jgi:hypothetical protein
MKHWTLGIPALTLFSAPALFAQDIIRYLARHPGAAECQTRTSRRIQDFGECERPDRPRCRIDQGVGVALSKRRPNSS